MEGLSAAVVVGAVILAVGWLLDTLLGHVLAQRMERIRHQHHVEQVMKEIEAEERFRKLDEPWRE